MSEKEELEKIPFNPLAKLVEELGELSQVAGKAIQVNGLDKAHWNMFLIQAFIEEAGDVIAAIKFLVEKYNVDSNKITERINLKLERFKQWDTNL